MLYIQVYTTIYGNRLLIALLTFFREFLAPGAHNPVNVEGRISELVRGRIENHVDRYCFEEAQVILNFKCTYRPNEATFYHQIGLK